MKHDKERWIEEVLESMSGSQRALPDPSLFIKIESNLDNTEGKVIHMSKWYFSVAAAFALMVLNFTAISRFHAIQSDQLSSMTIENQTTDELISSFNLYDE